MEVGAHIVTIVDKMTSEGLKDVFIPKGTKGIVCEMHKDYAFVEIWGDDAPEGVWGVYDFGFDEIAEED